MLALAQLLITLTLGEEQQEILAGENCCCTSNVIGSGK